MERKKFLRRLLVLSVPIIIQQFIQAALNMVDTVMIGRLGSDEIAAVGIANQVFFFVMLIIFGINSGVSVFIAQFYGRNDHKNIKKTMGVSLVSGLIVGILFCIVAVSIPRQLMSLFIDDAHVIELGVSYLRIVAYSYIFMAISMSFSVASRGIGKTVIPMLVTAIALSVNTTLNYGLIFGNFGLPALGIEGAAIATLIARIVEFVIMLSIIYGSKSLLAASIKDLLSFDLGFFKKIFIKAGPVLVNEIFWSLGTIVYMWSIGQIGAEAVASYQITLSAYRFYEVAFVGFGSAASVMIGNSIGAGDESLAVYYGKRISKGGLVFSLFTSLIMFMLAPLILKFFNVSDAVMADSLKLFHLYCVYGVFRVYNLMKIVGMFRGGGDTRFAMLAEMGSVWLVGVPMALIGSRVLHLSVVYVVWMILTEEVVKATLCAIRFRSGKWVHNVIHHIE
ncbi:MATE family efflux transporter [Acidaminobacter sp. JC074]|uniref:MATE family efflux transporter n=1 Tax=Acidaminobacter sp. JC074 TaxID=2530199 RepID=UPI001F0EE37A|nr:MATE family efflux transporter [Acidaminobacter sp. JC074]MCH4889490.1 MATE family efflux transporter [Acidaminobacter sp. JC074]